MDYKTFQPGGQEQNQVPMSEQRHFLNKKFMVTFVVLLLLGTGAYAGIWYWQNQQVAQEVVPTFTPRAGVTVGWKTYTNMQYGFEFKYSSADIVTEAEATQLDYLPNSRKFIGIYPSGGGQQDFSGRVDIYNAPLATVIRDDRELQSNREGKKLIVNGLSWTDLSVRNAGLYFYLIEKKGKTFEVSATEELSNQILSTFKFTDQGQTVCTQEAKQCSDGSYVSRTGPNCEFTACPGDGTLTGYVTIGPNCPVERVGVPCTPAPQAYTSRQVMVYKADGTTLVITQNFDAQGNYNIALPAGTYVVKSKTGISSILSVVGTVTIKNGQTSTLNFSIDTGIR